MSFARISVTLCALAVASCGKNSPDPGVLPEPISDGSVPDSPIVVDSPTEDAAQDVSTDAPSSVCPTGLTGPKLVKLPALDGSHYCMDAREVTAGEYALFAKAKGGNTTGQIADCEWNTAWEPKLVPPEPEERVYFDGYCAAADYDPVNYPSRGVACVDWCDALGYCAWAGKRLCGKVGGGTATLDGMNDAGKSEWANACTQGGKTKYPWGDTYTAGRCIDPTALQQGGESAKDVTKLTTSQCHGALDPFDDVYHLVGSVAEWTAECGTSGKSCAIHGLGTMYGPEPSCDAGSMWAKTTHRGIGFRCCVDVIATTP